jgi:hypothetical protein
MAAALAAALDEYYAARHSKDELRLAAARSAIERAAVTRYKESLIAEGRTIVSLASYREGVAAIERERQRCRP